ncbi:MAG: fibronectin type III domain-containing protein [Ignavibacteriae bacterium]|nr:fibronectin type III domain-containing protein [Ignavibacteriota bacterium]
MKYLGFKTLVFAVLMAFILVSCDETTTPTANKPEPPTNIRATSKDSTKIILKWDLSTSESDAKFTGYTLEISPSPLAPQSISKGVNTITIDNLSEGTVYTFKLYSVMDGEESATAATIDWSPATRFDLTVNGAPIRVYETDSDYGSGLDLYDPNDPGKAPKVWTVANGAEWNLALDTRATGKIIVGSPKMVNYNYGTQPRITEISSNHYWENAASLDDVFDSEALSSGAFTETTIDLAALDASVTSIVLVLRTIEPGNTENTYAKVLIKKSQSGWLQGAVGNRYIECIVSYQHTPGVPYSF